MADAVLTINAGSSSLKFSVYRIGERDQLELSAKGQVEGIGTAPHLVAEDAEGKVLVERRWPDDPRLGPRRVLPRDRRLAARAFRRPGVAARRRSPGRAWRHRVRGAGARQSRGARQARGALPAGAAASAAQSRRHPRGRRGPARPAAGGLLRHRVPPRPSRARRLVRAAAPVLRRRHPPLRLPRPVLRVHRERAARGRAGNCRGPRGGRPSRQRRQHVRDQGRPQPWTAPWASPRSTACPWARAAARSTRASCST